MEIWKDIFGYENKYQISNKGRVMSLNYGNTGKPRELKHNINKKTGLHQVELSKHNKKTTFMIARLVAEAFIPNPMQKPHVMHISKNKDDNSVENLAWAYISEEKHNTYNKGSRKNAIPTYTKISYNGKNYNKYADIAKDLGINQRTFKHRLQLGWGLYESLEIPIGKGVNK